MAKKKKPSIKSITASYYKDLENSAFSGNPGCERVEKTLLAEIRYLRKRSREDPLKETNNDLSQMSFEMSAMLWESLIPEITEETYDVIGKVWFAQYVSHMADYNLREGVDKTAQQRIVDGSAGKKEHKEARSLFADHAERFFPDANPDDLEDLTNGAWDKIRTHKYSVTETARQEPPKSKKTVGNWAKKFLGIDH